MWRGEARSVKGLSYASSARRTGRSAREERASRRARRPAQTSGTNCEAAKRRLPSIRRRSRDTSINQPCALYQKASCRNRIDDALVAGAPAYGLDNAVNGAPVEFVRSEGAFNVIVRSFERVDGRVDVPISQMDGDREARIDVKRGGDPARQNERHVSMAKPTNARQRPAENADEKQNAERREYHRLRQCDEKGRPHEDQEIAAPS